MSRLLTFSLLFITLFLTVAQTAAAYPQAGSIQAASLTAAQKEFGQLEALRQLHASWREDADTATSALRGMNTAAIKLTIAAAGEDKRWPQALKEWQAAAVGKALAETETRLQAIHPDSGDVDLAATLATLRERLASAHSALIDFDGKAVPTRLSGDLERSGAIFKTLSGASQAADTLRSQLDTRLRDLDTRLALLHRQIAVLSPTSLPAPTLPKP